MKKTLLRGSGRPAQHKVLCTAYDTEPFRNLFCTDPKDPAYDKEIAMEGEFAANEQNEAIERFIDGADLLIQDSQYTQEEYGSGRMGWGHSPIEHVCSKVNRADVKHMALFHHDPTRSDAQLDELAMIHCRKDTYGKTNIFFAREGMEIEM